jgi:recombination protein RecT
MTITAIQNNPDLLEADKESLYLAILKCAETGLSPDGKESALVVFNTKVGDNRWIKKVQFMPMVTGIVKKLGEVGVKVETETVHEFDFFEYEAGDNPRINHKPAKLGTDRGVMIGAYAILRMDGIATPYREVMDSKAIETVRQQSKAPNSLMWTKFAGEGYRKTVLRRCAKRIPMRFDESVERTIEADNESFEMGSATPAAEAERPADATVVAQIEQTKGETLEQAVQPKKQPVAQPNEEESENPAPKEERRAAPPKEKAAPAAASKLDAAPQKRPAALAAVVATSEDAEDIF